MKLFISWSGGFSKKVAERLSVWTQIIIQTVDVFYSPEDIAKGENWSNRLTKELEECNFGIVCLTPENIAAPWIHFEAGALSKATNSRVSAIMLGVAPSDLKGPLARLQNTAFDREDFFRLFQSINNSSDTPLRPEILKNAFENSCERLMNDLEAIINDYTSQPSTPNSEEIYIQQRNSDNDALQEILRLVRNFDSNQKAPVPTLHLVSSTQFNYDLLSWVTKLENSSKCSVLVACSKHCISETKRVVQRYSWESATSIGDGLSHSGYVIVNVSTDKIFSLFRELRDCGAEMGLYPNF